MANFLFDPLEQFNIVPFDFNYIGGFIFTIFGVFLNNFFIYFCLAIFSYIFFIVLPSLDNSLIPKTGWEHLSEVTYHFIYNVVEEQVHFDRFFVFLFAIFFFILFSNLVGLIPYGFTTTSFIIKTFFFGFSIFIGTTIIGLWLHGPKFFKIFIPSGVPGILLPFLILIEIVSYFCRPLSLSVRLFANMMAGHSLLNILASFALSLSKKSFIFGLIPFFVVLLISFLEIGIAFLQAYIFLVLTCIYLSDAFQPGH